MRTRQFLACAAAACLWSVVLMAQQKDPTSRVTVSGCVERADQLAGNAATTTVDSLSFVLVKPKPETPTGTSGSVTADATTLASDRLYRLDGPVEELNPHVGHKVEVSGTIAEAPTAPAGASSSTNAPRLKVESVKMLDVTCRR